MMHELIIALLVILIFTNTRYAAPLADKFDNLISAIRHKIKRLFNGT